MGLLGLANQNESIRSFGRFRDVREAQVEDHPPAIHDLRLVAAAVAHAMDPSGSRFRL